MACKYEIEVSSHNSIYVDNYEPSYGRKIKIYFSLPQNGINEDTGMVLFIAGFGGHAQSNVYKKMRDSFADEFNLVTVQCDYFGYEFMQTPNEKEIKDFINKNLDKNVLNVTKNENINNFADMGFMQAIDNINAVLHVINILSDNECMINTKKIILFGQSQGAYLSYLCNAFCPNMFSLLIDNSSWLFPAYLINDRFVDIDGDVPLHIIYHYLGSEVIKDKKILDLRYIYNEFNNKCNIIAYHGYNDWLAPYDTKKIFCHKIANCKFHGITNFDIDGHIFKNNGHGLGADFIELFRHVLKDSAIIFKQDSYLDLLLNVQFTTNFATYTIDYNNIFPCIHIEKK